VGPAEKGEAESAVAAAKAAIESNNPDNIKQAGERLSQAAMKIGEAVYKAEQAAGGGAGPQAGPGPQGGPSGGASGGAGPAQGDGRKGDGPIIDAEVVDEKKS